MAAKKRKKVTPSRLRTPKKPAAKKSAAKKPAKQAKQSATKKPAAKKASTKKKSASKTTSTAKKPVAKKSVTKKPAKKKPAAKKGVPQKNTPEKTKRAPTSKKAPAKKGGTKTPSRKAPAKKTPAKKPSTNKPAQVSAKAAAAEKKLAIAAAQVETLREQLADQKKLVGVEKARANEQAKRVTKLAKELQRSEAVKATLEKRAVSVRERLSELSRTGTKSSRQVTNLERQLSAANTEKRRSQQRIVELEKQLKVAAKAQITKSETAELRIQLGTARSDAVDARSKLASMQQKFQAIQIAKAELEQHVMQLDRRLADQSRERGSDQSRDLEASQNRLSELIDQLERERAAHEQTRLDLVQKQAMLAELERQAANHKLICPRCGGRMSEENRGGVTIDQCVDCQGLYFDQGELEEVLQGEGVDVGREETTISFPEYASEQVVETASTKPVTGGFFRSLFRRKGKSRSEVVN